jgi:hypothetical protein
MTVSSSTSRIEYTGDAVTTAFSFPYYFLANGDLKVYLDGVLQTITTHYTVSGAGVGAGGTVTFVTAPPNGDVVVIYREVAITQSVDYTPNDPFPANTHEQALDRLTMIAQQLDEEVGRSLSLPSTSTYSGLTLPDPVADYYLKWKADLSGLENSSSVYGSVTINTTAPLTGGGQLTTDRIFAISAASGGAAGSMSAADFTKLAGIETAADVTDATNVNAAGAVMHSDISPSDGLLRKTGAETYTTLKIKTDATGSPTVNDDSSAGYGVGSDWVDVTNDNIYKCADASVGAAVWVATGAAAGGVVSVGATAPVTSSGGTNPTIAISNNGVTNSILNDMATQTIKGRTTAGTGDPEDLTAAQARSVIGLTNNLVILDTPELLVNGVTTTGSWVTPAVSGTLSGAGAKAAILRVKQSGTLAAANTLQNRVYLRKTGSGLVVGNGLVACETRYDVATATTLVTLIAGEATVNLDASQQFDWQANITATGTSTVYIYLVGYYY